MGTQDTGRRLEKTKGQSRMDNPDTGNIGNTRHGTKVRENQRVIKNEQSRDTGNIENTRYGTKVRENPRAIKNGQSRDTGNIGNTRYGTKVRENPRAIKNGQSRDTGNIGHKAHDEDEQKRKKNNITQKNEQH